MRIKLLLATFAITIVSQSMQAVDFSPVEQLVKRQIPWLEGHIEFAAMNPVNNQETFELSSVSNKILVRASGVNAAAMGVNWYLKHYCHRSQSHLGDQMSPVSPLPMPNEKITKMAEFPVRYALNYCTINYTMSFYGWKEWERELDWMAMNGINVMLMPVGTEIVWQRTLAQFGFSKQEIAAFIPGPAFTAWWLMGNLEGWGGQVTNAMINRNHQLAKKIMKRMNELGINPIAQGFYGMVPTQLKEKTEAKIIEQGKWAGGFQRPDFLNPEDPLFSRMADVYYREMKKAYGSNIRYFGGEPFHEGGRSGDADVAQCGAIIQSRMQTHFPGSTWVLQGWQHNPSKTLLSRLDKSKTLVIELFGENSANWEKRNCYEQTPFVWCHVSNFGEKTGLYGKLQRFANEVSRAKTSACNGLMKGVGFIPEGINNNPVAYDLMTHLAWCNKQVDVNQWINDYILYRYGTTDVKMQQAWQLLLQTAYSSPAVNQEGPSESIFCARPSLNVESVSSWGTRKRNYDTQLFEQAVLLFVEAGKEIPHTETYLADRTDFVRQLMANRADAVYEAMIQSVANNDKLTFNATYRKFEEMLLQQDSLLNSNPLFALSTWLNQAKALGKNDAEKKLNLWNAKTQITYWGPNHPDTDLHDYAHKEWGGLLRTLYLSRWRLFAQAMQARMSGQSMEENYYDMERSWAESKETPPMTILSDYQLNELIGKIIASE